MTRSSATCLLVVLLLLVSAGDVSASESVSLGVPVPFGDPASAPVLQSQHSVAAGAEGFLAAWVDFRAGDGEIWAARIGSDGDLLDPHGFLVSDRSIASFEYSDPVVAWAGGVYLVVWERDYLNLEGVRISPQGELLDARPIALGEGGIGGGPRLVSNGSRFLLAAPYFPLRLTMIDPSGEIVAMPHDPILNSIDGWWFALTSNGNDFFALSSRRDNPDFISHDTILIQIGADGEVSWAPTTIGDGIRFASMEWDGEHLLLALAPYWSSPHNDLRVIRLTTGGEIIEQTSVESIGALSPSLERMPNGPTRLVWVEPSESTGAFGNLRSATIEQMTIDIDPEVIERVHDPVTAQASGNLVLLWSTGAESGLLGSRYAVYDSAAFGTVEAKPLSFAAPSQSAPAMARSETSLLVAWLAQSQDSPTRIEIAIEPLIPLSSGRGRPLLSSDERQDAPAVASDGRDFLVVWEQSWSEVWAQRIDGNGTSLSEPIRLSSEGIWSTEPAVTWNGRFYLVAFQQEYEEIVLVRVTADGILVDPSPAPVIASPRGAGQSHAAIATLYDGTSMLVWQDGAGVYHCRITCPPPPPPGLILGVRLDPDGNVVDSVPIRISPALDYELSPAIATSGGQYLVAWMTTAEIAAARVSRDGQVLDHAGAEAQITFPGLAPTPPVVTRFVEGWMVGAGQQEETVRGSVMAYTVDATGEVSGPPLRLASQFRDQQIALMSLSAHLALLAYVDLTSPTSSWGGTPRLFSKTVGSPASSITGPRRRTIRR